MHCFAELDIPHRPWVMFNPIQTILLTSNPVQHAVISEPVSKGRRITLELGSSPSHTSIPQGLLSQLGEEPGNKGALQGRLVDPMLPRKRQGVYWGYSVRIANGLTAALEQCAFQVRGDGCVQ